MKRGLKFDILAHNDDVAVFEVSEWQTQMFVRTYAAHGYLTKYGIILLPTATAVREGHGLKPKAYLAWETSQDAYLLCFGVRK